MKSTPPSFLPLCLWERAEMKEGGGIGKEWKVFLMEGEEEEEEEEEEGK